MKKQDIEKKLAALPDKRRASLEKWTIQEDALLFKYGPIKSIEAIAAILDKPKNQAFKRLKFLQAQMKKGAK